MGASSSCSAPWNLIDIGGDCNGDGGDLHGGWKNWYDWEHVLEGVDEVGEGEHGEGERVDVPGLQHHLALQQDQADYLEEDIYRLIPR